MTSHKSELYYLTIKEASVLIQEHQLSPVELTNAFLERIDRLDPKLQSYITVLPDNALSEAKNAESDIMNGLYKGELHGIPIALKDLYDTRNIRTTASSRIMKDRIPSEDATTTSRLKSSGAILLGKLSMHEFALGGPDHTCGFPLARNPWNVKHGPSGSSSGSGVATAAGLCMGSLGSCTGGSIRGPASICGIVGLKPTYGRVSRHGVVPLSWTLDHCGPMTWTVEDTAIMLQAISGYDPKDPTSSKVPVPNYSDSLIEDLKGVRIGIPKHFFFADDSRIDKETLKVVGLAIETLQDLGAIIQEITIPSLEHIGHAQRVIMLSEAFTYHRRNLSIRPNDFGEMVREWFRMGALYSASDYIQSQRMRKTLQNEFAQVFKKVDLIASPTMSQPAPLFDQIELMSTAKLLSFTSPYNMSGMPAISIPCGFTTSGLPIGLQLAARPFDEATIIRASYTYQQKTRLFEKRPNI